MRRRAILALVLAGSWGAVANGALVHFMGFETANEQELQATTGTGTGTAVVQGSIQRTGDWALRTNCPAAADTCYGAFRGLSTGGTDSDQVVTDHYVTLYIRFATLPAANSEPIFHSRSSADALKGEIRINSAGHLEAYNNSGTVAVGSVGTATLTTGVWYCLQIRIGTGGATGPITVAVDGVADISGTGNLLTGGTARTRLGKAANRNSQAVDMYFDDVVVDNSSQPACGQQVTRMDVDGDGSGGTAWTIGAGGGADYTNLDEVPSDGNTSYLLSTSVDADVQGVSLESSTSATITGTIAAVKAYAFFRRDNTSGSTQGTIQLGIRSNGVQSLGSDSVINPSTVTSYDPRQLLFTTNPDGSAAWTLAALDSLEIEAVEAETTDKTRVTAMYAHVLYTPGGGGGGGGGLKGLLLMGLGGGAQ